MEELRKPKAKKARFQPRKGGFREGQASAVQGPAHPGQEASQVKEAGERAEKGVVGEAAVAEEEGVGPPEEPEYSPAPG